MEVKQKQTIVQHLNRQCVRDSFTCISYK
jgi:hypothetical protein